MELQDFIKKFVDALEIENASTITGDINFRNLDEWSSLSIMLLIAMFDEEFGKEITNKDIQNCITIADLYNFAIK